MSDQFASKELHQNEFRKTLEYFPTNLSQHQFIMLHTNSTMYIKTKTSPLHLQKNKTVRMTKFELSFGLRASQEQEQ